MRESSQSKGWEFWGYNVSDRLSPSKCGTTAVSATGYRSTRYDFFSSRAFFLGLLIAHIKVDRVAITKVFENRSHASGDDG